MPLAEARRTGSWKASARSQAQAAVARSGRGSQEPADASGSSFEPLETGTSVGSRLASIVHDILLPEYSTKAPDRGSGLWLLVARGIVLEHMGANDVQSELGKGTAFRIRLLGEPAVAAGVGTHPAAG